jgi:hypothetical protein
MLAEIRLILHEPVAANSFWTDPELLMYFNMSIDKRVMELADAHEGWVTDGYTADLVAGQNSYTLPEGCGRVKRVLIVRTSGSTVVETPLIRNQKWSERAVTTNVSGTDCLPTYRLMGEMLYLDPPYGKAITGGLKIEAETAPARLTAGASTLPQRFPDIMETVLEYDTCLLALAAEGSQGELPEGHVHHIRTEAAKVDRLFKEYIEGRTQGRTFGQGFYLGD